MNSGLRVEAVSKTYGATLAVDSVSFSAEPGEFVTLLGPSGCGKTTTLRMIAGFVSPTAGRIEIVGADVTHVAPNRRNVGLVFQSYALFPHMDVADNVAFGLRMRGVPRRARDPRVAEALAMVKLGDLARRFPRQLSGGQQQRVALARALIISPQVLLLDEPFGALDKQLRDHMRDELLALQRRLGIATLFVTHDQQEALSMSDRVVVMNRGRVEQIGAPAEIYERPQTRFVAEFLGRSNLLEMQVRPGESGGMVLSSGALTVPFSAPQRVLPGTQVTVMIRPESIQLLLATGRGRLENSGCVAAVTYLGAVIQVRLTLDDGIGLEVLTSRRALDGIELAAGTRLGIDVFADGVWMLEKSAEAAAARCATM